MDRYILKPEIEAITGLSESTRFRLQALGQFPPYERIALRRVGLRESTLRRWMDGERSGWNCAA